MKILRLAVALFTVTTLSGCVSVPPLQAPTSLSSSDNYQFYRDPVLDRTDHTIQHLNQTKDTLYIQNYGGGGATVGVLLGPLGVAANIKMIEGVTLKETAILKDKIRIAPQQQFLKAASEFGIQQNPSTGTANKLNPYVLVEKTANETLKVASVILVEDLTSKFKWPKKYMVQLPVSYSIQELASLDDKKSAELEKAVQQGYSTLLARMKKESSVSLTSEEKVIVVSEFLTPRFSFEMPANLVEKDETRTWVRTAAGVFGVLNNDITVKSTSKKK